MKNAGVDDSQWLTDSQVHAMNSFVTASSLVKVTKCVKYCLFHIFWIAGVQTEVDLAQGAKLSVGLSHGPADLINMCFIDGALSQNATAQSPNSHTKARKNIDDGICILCTFCCICSLMVVCVSFDCFFCHPAGGRRQRQGARD